MRIHPLNGDSADGRVAVLFCRCSYKIRNLKTKQLQPVLFLLNGTLPANGYLPGLASWPTAVQLTGASVICPQGFPGTVTLSLEVNGAITGDVLTLSNGCAGTRGAVALAVPVPAGQKVRWRCGYAGDYTTAPQQVQLTVVARPLASIRAATMDLVWAQTGSAPITLFSFDPEAAEFTDVSGGSSVGRAYVEDPEDRWSLFVQGVEMMRVADGVLYLANLEEGGLPDLSAGALQFMVNGAAWLTMTSAEVVAGRVMEVAGADDLPANFYQFSWDNTVLCASGLYALEIQEGIPD